MHLLTTNHRSSRTVLPLVPVEVLRRFHVYERHDDRLKSCSRLLSALWLRRHGIAMGVHRGRDGRARRLGSRLSTTAAQAGRNFITQELAELAQRVIAYREPGAFMPTERVISNALSSTTLCLQAMGVLALDLELAARVLRRLLPDQDIDQVTGIVFEHSPNRRDNALTGDASAFDCVVSFIRERGTSHDQRFGMIAMEWKLTEGLHESAPCPPGRYDDVAERLVSIRTRTTPRFV